MKTIVWRYPRPSLSRTNVCIGHVTAVATSITKVTAVPMPAAWSSFLENSEEGADTEELVKYIVVNKYA